MKVIKIELAGAMRLLKIIKVKSTSFIANQFLV